MDCHFFNLLQSEKETNNNYARLCCFQGLKVKVAIKLK